MSAEDEEARADEWVARMVAAGGTEITGELAVAYEMAERLIADFGGDYTFPQPTDEDDAESWLPRYEAWKEEVAFIEEELQRRKKIALSARKGIEALIAITDSERELGRLEDALGSAGLVLQSIYIARSTACRKGKSSGGKSDQARPTAALQLYRLGYSKTKIAEYLDADRRDVIRWLKNLECFERELWPEGLVSELEEEEET